MSDVEISTCDHRLFLLQLLEICQEIVLPAHAVIKALELILGVGRIDADQEEVGHLQREDAPLVGVLLDAYALADYSSFASNGAFLIRRMLFNVIISSVSLEGVFNNQAINEILEPRLIR